MSSSKPKPRLRLCADGPIVTDLRPSHYLTVHQSAIRALAWIQAPPSSASGEPNMDEDPTVIASGGYDGVECLLDIREGRGAIMNRTRGKEDGLSVIAEGLMHTFAL